MKMTVSVLGVALLTAVLALTQTGSTGQKSSKSKTADTSATSQGTSSTNANSSSDTSGQTSSGTQSGDTSASQVKVGNSGFDDVSSDKPGSSSGTQNASVNGDSGRAASADGSSSTPASSYKQSGSQSSSSTAISNGPVAETITDHSALIGWATQDAASNSGVTYGTNRANLTETAQGIDGADAKNHHARLQGLQPNTHYYFQVTENGSPVSGVGTFKTTARGEAPIQSKAVIPQK